MSIAISVLVRQKVTLKIVFIINQRTFIFWKKMALYRSCWKRNFKRQKVNDASSSLGPFCLASDRREIDIASSINFPANYTSSAFKRNHSVALIEKIEKMYSVQKSCCWVFSQIYEHCVKPEFHPGCLTVFSVSLWAESLKMVKNDGKKILIR